MGICCRSRVDTVNQDLLLAHSGPTELSKANRFLVISGVVFGVTTAITIICVIGFSVLSHHDQQNVRAELAEEGGGNEMGLALSITAGPMVVGIGLAVFIVAVLRKCRAEEAVV